MRIRVALVVLVLWALCLTTLFTGWQELLTRYWIVTPVAFLAAAFANATAVGGGFLFVPLFILVYGLDPLSTLKLSLGTQAFGMTSGALGWRRFLDLRSLALACIGGFIGMAVGTFWWTPSGQQVKSTFGWVSIGIVLVMLAEMRLGSPADGEGSTPSRPRGEAFLVLLCVGGGLVNAWVSIGIGEVVALWMMWRYRVPVERAIGTGVATLAFCSLVGTAFHGILGGIPWELLVFTAPGVILGGQAGALFGRYVEARSRRSQHPPGWPGYSPLKAIFTVVVLVDGLVMLLQAMKRTL